MDAASLSSLPQRWQALRQRRPALALCLAFAKADQRPFLIALLEWEDELLPKTSAASETQEAGMLRGMREAWWHDTLQQAIEGNSEALRHPLLPPLSALIVNPALHLPLQHWLEAACRGDLPQTARCRAVIAQHLETLGVSPSADTLNAAEAASEALACRLAGAAADEKNIITLLQTARPHYHKLSGFLRAHYQLARINGARSDAPAKATSLPVLRLTLRMLFSLR